MSKTKKHITVLAIGDRSDYDSYKKFHKEKRSFLISGFDYIDLNYRRFLKGRIPRIDTEKVIIFLFFPFSYWNKYIEHKNYRGVYGNHTFFNKFIRFWKKVDCTIKRELAGKEILFVNHPRLCGQYRDKMSVIKKIASVNIPQPKLYKVSSLQKIYNLLEQNSNLFIKPRYGSMGKGITFLSLFDWQTNFIFRNDKIISRKSDRGWEFHPVTRNHMFIRKLLKADMLVQKAIDLSIIKHNKVDLRIYTFFNKVIYVYPRKNTPDKLTTNISQGGKGAPHFLKLLPRSLIIKVKKTAEDVSRLLNLNFAGIDILPDKNFKNIYVVDVNVFSGFPRLKTFNLPRHVARELRRLDKKGELKFKKVI